MSPRRGGRADLSHAQRRQARMEARRALGGEGTAIGSFLAGDGPTIWNALTVPNSATV